MDEWKNNECMSEWMKEWKLQIQSNEIYITVLLLEKNWNPARWMLLSNSSWIQTRKGKENQSSVPRIVVQITEVNAFIYIRINTNIYSTQTRIMHNILYWFKFLILITSEIIKYLYRSILVLPITKPCKLVCGYIKLRRNKPSDS
jgi:hypothetical protein